MPPIYPFFFFFFFFLVLGKQVRGCAHTFQQLRVCASIHLFMRAAECLTAGFSFRHAGSRGLNLHVSHMSD